MSENFLQLLTIVKVVICLVYAWLYASGGIAGKWKRRFIAPGILVGAICLFSVLNGTFNWWYLTTLPALIGALTLPYGADETKEKIVKRFICALALIVAPISLFIINGAWAGLAIHAGLCLCSHIILGVINPFNARIEETLIALFTSIIPIMVI